MLGETVNRIDEFLIKDKFMNLEQVAEILKSEITPLALNFFLLSDDVVVRYRREKTGFAFNVEIQASRIKPFGNRII